VTPEFSLPVRVYIEDTDAGGIVYYVNYLKFMERARTELLRTLGYNKPAVLDEDLLLVVHSAQIDYKSPAFLDDALSVTAEIERMGRTYVLFRQRVMRADQCLADAQVKVACVSRSPMRAAALPEPFYKKLKEIVEL
jgi:4-hydroxybenzoyl-CoA thioesterase